MISVKLTNTMLNQIMAIEKNKSSFKSIQIPVIERNKLRKMSKKKSTYASNKIEGNPLGENQVNAVIDENDPHRHFLRPEIEVRNYFVALNTLEEKLKGKEPFSRKLILEIQAIVEKGASHEKIGLRGPMPPGMLFAVYDATSGNVEYIPPEYSEVPALLDELVDYVNSSNDHPLIKAAVVHYELVTIHPFEDGNGRTARLISGYVLDFYGYGFGGIGSLEEYFAYNQDEYYASLQMGLPALYYEGRKNPPHPEIWVEYFLRMLELYSKKVYELSKDAEKDDISQSLSFLNNKEKSFFAYLLKNKIFSYKPIEMSGKMKVSNRTIANWSASLAKQGFVIPNLVHTRIASYALSDFTIKREKKILKILKGNW